MTLKASRYAGLLVPVLIGLAASPALSAPDPALSACRQIADQIARVACYDKAMDKQANEQSAGTEAKPPVASPRQTFGLSHPPRPPRPLRAPAHRGVPKVKPVDGITVELAKAERDLQGDWVMTTTEGAVWRQVNDDRPYKPPHVGSTMGIKRALMGGFFCTIDGQAAVRCVRDD